MRNICLFFFLFFSFQSYHPSEAELALWPQIVYGPDLGNPDLLPH